MIIKEDIIYGVVPLLGEEFEFDFPDLGVEPVLPNATLVDVRAAFIFRRKDSFAKDALGKPRNPSYSSDTDPIIIQATFFVDPHAKDNDLYDCLSGWHQTELEFSTELKRTKLLEEQARITRELEELNDISNSRR